MTTKTILHYEDAMRRIANLPWGTNQAARVIALAALGPEEEVTPLLSTAEMVGVLGDIILGGGSEWRGTMHQKRLIMRYIDALPKREGKE